MHSCHNSNDDIKCAAQLLRISETQVFGRAYKESHNRAATDDVLEACYSHYVYHGSAPAWARGFVRRMMTEHVEPQVVSPSCSSFDYILKLFLPPHGPGTLGSQRYRILIA